MTSVPLLPYGSIGWVFCGDETEDLRRILHPGDRRLWGDARSVGKESGQPVLFLQARKDASSWVGFGSIVSNEQRWKAFGVWVRCERLLDEPLPTRAPGVTPPSAVERASAWDNPLLAVRLGLQGVRARTPFLGDGCDLRLTAADAERMLRIQPALGRLWPRGRTAVRKGESPSNA